ncbi:Pentatricopeptide repeat-containing protein [Forsythia ovata]|uniref:Pentatricopeptide repeat-containing protein n=1 Tax=Forsythia ovata TaxID=205694 RepID=A0ABD1V267_9LAMI
MRSYLFQITSKIAVFAKSGRISCARKLFDEMPQRDTVAWNAMLSGYCHLGLHQDALSLLECMRVGNVKPDHFTFTAVLSVCAGKDLHFGQKFHALVTVSGYNSSLPVNNALVDMYGKCSSVENANRVFEEMSFRNEVSWCSLLFAYVNVGVFDVANSILCAMPKRVVIAWNTMIAGFAKWGRMEFCMDLFKKMLKNPCSPDQWTLSALMNACAETSECCYGCNVHGFIVRSGWSSAVEVNNSVISFYASFGDENGVLKAVESSEILTQVSWNVIIDAQMKIGNIDEACLAFQQAPEKNLVSWTSMIAGYARHGHAEHSMRFFIDMMRGGLMPDDFTFGAVLHACSNLAMLGHGRMVHCCAIQFGFYAYAYVGNGLVNMYAKCGDIEGSCMAFSDVLEKDLISWNTILFAFGLHGHSIQALQILEEMVAYGVKPDKVTFIGLLMTCSHLGLIEEGLVIFESMSSNYGLYPEIDHVACMVDMLGRGGKLEEARAFANRYLGKNSVEFSSVEALLGSYSTQGNIRGAEMGEQLQILKPRNEMSYVLLSNLYCASGQWKQAEIVRKAMADQGVKKMPGCSWIEVRNKVATFVAGRIQSLYMEEVYKMLHVLESEIRYPWSIHFWDGIT